MALTNEDKLYRFLRENNVSNLDEIYVGLNKEVSKTEILQHITTGTRKGYIHVEEGETTKEDKFTLKFVLDKVRVVDSDGYWNYSDLKRVSHQALSSDEIEYLPKRADQIIERSQGNVGSCTGAASSAMMDDIHMSLCPDDYITDEERAEARKNVKLENGGYYDKTWWKSISQAGIYWRSKKIYNIPGSGSYIDLCLKVLVNEGAGRDWQWIHRKDGAAQFTEPYPDECPKTGEKYFDTAESHKIDGFARCSTNLSMLNALQEHDGRGLLAAMRIAEGTLNKARGNGIWNSWDGKDIGGHAVLIKGRKRIGNKWGWLFYNWWVDSGYPREEWMSDDYWGRAKVDCFTALDSEESSFIREIVRQRIEIITNAPAKIYIDEKYHGNTTDNKISAQLQREKEYLLEARKSSNIFIKASKRVKITEDLMKVELFFEENPEPSSPSISNLRKRIKEMIERLKKRFYKIN